MKKIFIVSLYRTLWDSSIMWLVLAPSSGYLGCFLVLFLTQTMMRNLLAKFLLEAWKALRPNFLTLLS